MCIVEGDDPGARLFRVKSIEKTKMHEDMVVANHDSSEPGFRVNFHYYFVSTKIRRS